MFVSSVFGPVVTFFWEYIIYSQSINVEFGGQVFMVSGFCIIMIGAVRKIIIKINEQVFCGRVSGNSFNHIPLPFFIRLLHVLIPLRYFCSPIQNASYEWMAHSDCRIWQGVASIENTTPIKLTTTILPTCYYSM